MCNYSMRVDLVRNVFLYSRVHLKVHVFLCSGPYHTHVFYPPPPLQATSLIGVCDAAWRKCDLMRRLDDKIAMLQSTCQRLQLQLARYQWLFEDDVITSSVVLPNRATVMSELRKVTAVFR